jgi:DNA topoisomerase-1
MASMMKPRVNLETKVIFEQDDKQFQLQGKTIQFEGFSKAYRKFEKLSEDKIQSFVVGQQYEVDNYEIKEKETKPPFRYNSGSIVRTMEELGIGRPSTYVATLETLQKRNYIQYKAGTISPSDQGMLTTDKLSQFFDHLVDATYTALMEKQLDEIENGKVDKLHVLQQFYQDFESKLAHAQLHMEKIKPETLDEDCPVCGKKLMIRKGKFGDFVGCSGYPDCTYIRSQTKEIPDNAKTCPKCKQGKLIMRKGKYGNFLACNRYPDCDYVEKFKNFTKKT